MGSTWKAECPVCGEAVDVIVDSEQINGAWVTHGVEIDLRGCEHELVYDHEGLRAKDDKLLPPRKTFAELMAMDTTDDDGDEDLTKGLVFLKLLETRLRRMDLAQIGYLLLGTIGEANHGGWDGSTREELVGIDLFFRDLVEITNYDPEQRAKQPWGFGAGETWDVDGKRSFE
jgi:hypothetical protein